MGIFTTVLDALKSVIPAAGGVDSVAVTGTVTSTPSGTQNVNVTQYGSTSTTLGQKASSASQPVVIASDQSAVPVSGSVSAAVTGTVTANQGTAGSQNWLVKEQAKLVAGVTYDTIQVTAVNANNDPTTILYKSGGLAGSTVATLTIAYDGSGDFQSVVKT